MTKDMTVEERSKNNKVNDRGIANNRINDR